MIYLFPFITVLIWSGNAINNKLAASVIEPNAMSFYRWFIAVVLLTPVCIPGVIKQWAVIKESWLKLAILALLGMAITQSLGYYAAQSTTASNMALIMALVPLLSVFLSVPLLKSRLSSLNIIGGVVSLLGLSYMLGRGDILFFTHKTVTQGDGLMIASASVYALYCVLVKRWNMPLSTWTFIYMQGVFAVIILLPLLLTSHQIIPSVASLPVVMYAAIPASVIAPWLWVKSIRQLGAEASAMFMNLSPVITLVLAANFLDEPIHLYHIVGGVAVITGVLLSQLPISKKPRKKGVRVTS